MKPIEPTAAAVARALERIDDPSGPTAADALDTALGALRAASDAPACIPALLRLLERFPTCEEEHFWGVVHALEDLPGYEPLLVASVRHAPAALSVMMVNRLLNDGMTEVGGKELLAVLEELANGAGYDEHVRAEARGYLARQRAAR